MWDPGGDFRHRRAEKAIKSTSDRSLQSAVFIHSVLDAPSHAGNVRVFLGIGLQIVFVPDASIELSSDSGSKVDVPQRRSECDRGCSHLSCETGSPGTRPGLCICNSSLVARQYCRFALGLESAVSFTSQVVVSAIRRLSERFFPPASSGSLPALILYAKSVFRTHDPGR